MRRPRTEEMMRWFKLRKQKEEARILSVAEAEKEGVPWNVFSSMDESDIEELNRVFPVNPTGIGIGIHGSQEYL